MCSNLQYSTWKEGGGGGGVWRCCIRFIGPMIMCFTEGQLQQTDQSDSTQKKLLDIKKKRLLKFTVILALHKQNLHIEIKNKQNNGSN